MESLDIFLSHTFSSLETFLQKATTLNIFEVLIFNYKIKVNSVEQCAPQLIAFVVDLCNELQIILRDNVGVIEKTGTTAFGQPPSAELIDISSLDVESSGVSGVRNKGEWNIAENDIRVSSVQNESISQSDGSDNPQEKQSTIIYSCDHCKRKYRTGGKYLKHVCKCNSAALRDEDSIDDANSIVGDRIYKQPTLTSEESIYVCAVCFTTYSQQESFERHKQEDNSQNGRCAQSAEPLTDGERLRKVRRFTCGECGEVYHSVVRISYHVAHCRAGPYPCEVCAYVADTKRLLNAHKKKLHRDVESFFCSECGLGFKLRTSLQKHMVNRHETEQGAFTCNYDGCKRVFPKKIHLTNHKMEAHGLEGKYLCQVCGHKFMTQDSLSAHFESHSNKKKFQCKFCTKTFTTKEKMTYHIRVHTGEKPFACEHRGCGKSFVSKAKLAEHEQRHSGVRRHACQLCPKRYANKTDLRMHYRNVHHEPTEKPDVPETATEQGSQVPSTADAVTAPQPDGEGDQLFTSVLPYSCYSQSLQLVPVPQSIIITSYNTIIAEELPSREEGAASVRSWEHK